MKKFEELYTVDDIAQMTMLTSRTIRNYLKDGLLTGRKIGGQWRFTKKDIESLFNNSTVEEEMKDQQRQEVMDFMNGVNTDMEGEIQLCTIADYYCSDMQMAKDLSQRFSSIMADQAGTSQLRFYYEYIENEQKARYTFFGTPRFIMDAAGMLEEEWSRLNKTQFNFTDRADNYAKYRPSYPREAVDYIHDLTGKKINMIADIGSGTGKMTELLLEKENIVYAVEPNADMRKEAEKKLGSNKNFHSISKTAENTSLKAKSMDLIVCAESYHWFDHESTAYELQRILKPNGYVVLLWNSPGDNPYKKELGELCESYAGKNSKDEVIASKEERARRLFGDGNFKKVEFENNIIQPYEGLLGGMLSASFAPKLGEEGYIEYEKCIRNIFEQYSKDGLIETKFLTICYSGKL